MAMQLASLVATTFFLGCNNKTTVEKPKPSFEVEDDHASHSHSHSEDGEATVAIKTSHGTVRIVESSESIGRKAE